MLPTALPATCRAGRVLRARHLGIVEIAEGAAPVRETSGRVGRRDVPRGVQEQLHIQPRLEAFARDAGEAAGFACADERRISRSRRDTLNARKDPSLPTTADEPPVSTLRHRFPS